MLKCFCYILYSWIPVYTGMAEKQIIGLLADGTVGKILE
jgi:hypothetical protein